MKKLISYLDIIEELLFSLFPIKKDTVVFYSFNGQYNDNPKFISIELHKKAPNYHQVWILNDNDYLKTPEYVIRCKKGSVLEKYYRSTAEFYIDNYTGKHTIRRKTKIPYILRLLKRKGQLNISTWHGTPLKKIHNDISGLKCNSRNSFSTCDLFVSGNAYLSNIISKSLGGNLNVANVGSPRNDYLINAKESDIVEIKHKLGISDGIKVLLYAPTFRDLKENSGFSQLDQIDIPSLLSEMSQKFGGKWVFVFRAHPTLTDYIKDHYKNLFNNGLIINGNKYNEMAEYLLVADALITDYSGSLFDYCLLNRPCFLFSDDLQRYSEKERGLYMEISKLPFTFSDSFNKLISNIKAYNQELQNEKVKLFTSQLGFCEYGKSCEYVVEYIMNYSKKDCIRYEFHNSKD